MQAFTRATDEKQVKPEFDIGQCSNFPRQRADSSRRHAQVGTRHLTKHSDWSMRCKPEELDDIIFQNKAAIGLRTLAFQARKCLQETTLASDNRRYRPNDSSEPMEEKHTGKERQHQHIASGESQVVIADFGVSSDEMGANRSGSTSSTAGLVGGDVSGGCSSTTSSRNPPPRQSSKRDSGYHTDCSPATFSTTVPQFTFDPTDPRLSVGQGSGDSRPSMSPGVDCPQSVIHGSHDSHTASQTGHPARSATLARSGWREVTSVPTSMGRGYTLSPGWQPQRVVPEVSDDEDDDAFVSESVMLAAGRSALQSRLATRMARVGLGSRHGRSSPDPDADTTRVSSPRLGYVSEETDERDDRSGGDNNASTSRIRRHLSSSSRNVVLVPRGDDDDDTFVSEDDVATTDYIHAPLSVLMLPGGERMRPLIARTIATQTPHLHCQLIDQILDCPQGVPACARGSAVRRLRYYSEGEETVGTSYLPHGPLPDLVPVSHVTRERSLSAPDLETLQRQRLAAREVGRELRRISDEFLLSYNVRDNRDGALAALHAELNGVAAFFLTGVRRFVFRNFAGYFRHVFNWTRRAMNSADHCDTLDSSVDDQR